MIYEWPDGQLLIGPAVAELQLLEPAEGVSPYPLVLGVALTSEQRYVATRLLVRADSMAHEGGHLSAPVPIARLMPDAELPSVTARGLAAISLPTIMREGLQRKCRRRFRNARGDLVEGIAPDDDLPFTYLVARATGGSPVQEVARELRIGVGAARQRVARARAAGLLPPTTRGAR